MPATLAASPHWFSYPRETTIVHNHFHGIGVWGKQSAALFQAIACRTTFTHNVAYNGPRAAININDGFCGGTHLEANVLFNWVRPRSAPRRARCSQHDSPC